MKISSQNHALVARASGPLHGLCRVPGDKSISHRALMLAGVADGETIISGLLEGEDVLSTAAALRALGVRVYRGDEGLWHVFGNGIDGLTEPTSIIDMGNSGTSTRLLLGLMASSPINVCVTGDASLVKRPMQRVIGPLSEIGATFMARDGGRLPLAMKGTKTPKAITYRLPVASAQVKSAVLLAGLNTPGITTVIEPEATRDHTENMLRHFGVKISTVKDADGVATISLQGQQRLQGCAIDVPSDPSSAAFPAAAAVLHNGSDVTLQRIGINPTRAGFYQTLRDMGADITFKNERVEAGEPVADIVVRGIGALNGVTVPPERVPSMIDEFPILAMVAACANGTTTMTNLSELRVKESDRLKLIADGLQACGVKLDMGQDSLIIHGAGKIPQGGASIETALDHRIAMSFLVLGTVTPQPITIDDAGPIATSFPNFVDLMNMIGCDISAGAEFA
jgi:3-phosphoshikimate 1-carboxyvinyltransferase